MDPLFSLPYDGKAFINALPGYYLMISESGPINFRHTYDEELKNHLCTLGFLSVPYPEGGYILLPRTLPGPDFILLPLVNKEGDRIKDALYPIYSQESINDLKIAFNKIPQPIGEIDSVKILFKKSSIDGICAIVPSNKVPELFVIGNNFFVFNFYIIKNGKKIYKSLLIKFPLDVLNKVLVLKIPLNYQKWLKPLSSKVIHEISIALKIDISYIIFISR